jgi:hypothetical protein
MPILSPGATIHHRWCANEDGTWTKVRTIWHKNNKQDYSVLETISKEEYFKRKLAKKL